MALHSPLEVTVGRDTPVHIHVSRNSKSKAQALSESLTQEINRTSGRSYADRKADLSVDDLKTNCCDCHKSRRCCSCHRRDEPIDIYGRYGTIFSVFSHARQRRRSGAVGAGAASRGGQPARLSARPRGRDGPHPPPAGVNFTHEVRCYIDTVKLTRVCRGRTDLGRQLRDFDEANRKLKQMIRVRAHYCA